MLRFVIDPGANHGVGVAFTDATAATRSPTGATARAGGFGEFNLGRTDEDPAVIDHVEQLRSRLGLGPVMVCHQVHGRDVWRVSADDVEGWVPQRYLGDAVAGQDPLPVADAMVTDLPGVALAVRVADCVPVVLADPGAGVIAVAHAGRVGFLAGVLPATVAAMRDMGATEIMAWIGPHICGRCYEVPAEMAEAVWAKYPATRATTRIGTPALDLGAGALAQLEDLSVSAVGLDPCTFEDESLYSHRRDPGAGRLAGVVWTRPERPPAR